MRNLKRFAALAVAAAAVATGIAAGQSDAARADRAPNPAAVLQQPRLLFGLLVVSGTAGNDSIALRLQAGPPDVLEADVDNAVFSFRRADIARILVAAGPGDDRVSIDESNGLFTDRIPTTLDGGAGDDSIVGGGGAVTLLGGPGNDQLIGGNGAETLVGGPGNDFMDGNRGNDAAFMGSGDDTFQWDPGDGSDSIEGDQGTDTMLFNGANIAEKVDLSANGNRLRFTRDVANITMDTHAVERVDFNALGGADQIMVHDLAATDVRSVNVDLAGSGGGGDGAADRVLVDGTNGNDAIDVSGDATQVKVSGLAATVRILNPEVANDRLDISTLAGNDTVSSAGLAAGAIQLFVDGALVP
jgi:RTX calcium-binding nonapeptide repeat (4 copies)